jgi:hypothetical protein
VQFRLDERLAGWEVAIEDDALQRFTTGSRRDRELELCRRLVLSPVMHPGLHADLACLRVRPGEQVVDADRRHDEQFHRVDDPAVVIGSPGSIRDDLVPMRCFAEHDAVNRLIGGIEDTDRQQTLSTGANRVGYIDYKRRLAAFVLADASAVQPDLRQIVHRPEPQQIAPAGVRIGRCVQLPPIPRHAVITGKSVLDDPRHLGRLGLRPGRLEPLLFPPRVRRIGGQQPAVAIEGNDSGTPGLRGGCRCHRLTSANTGTSDQQ